VRRWYGSILVLLLALLPVAVTAAADTANATGGANAGTDRMAGSLTAVGSDTLADLMSAWAQSFRRRHPTVNFQLQAAGSSTAPPALTEGTASLGPMSRRMTSAEVEAFRRRFGYPPTAVPVALDALAVYVNPSVPLRAVTVAELEAIFSATRRCTGGDPISDWSRLTAGAISGRIQPVGRNSVSGTYGYFKSTLLCGGDFASGVYELPGSASVVRAVASNRLAIGYSSIGFSSPRVRALSILAHAGEAALAPTPENIAAGRYPLARNLYIYVNKPPSGALPGAERAFMRFVLTREGQRIVREHGYVALPDAIVAQSLNTLDIES
jgi:phosphate transport system substrate-binding protein